MKQDGFEQSIVELTLSERKDIAEEIINECENAKIDDVYLNPDGVSGKMIVGENDSIEWHISKQGDFYTAGTIPKTDGSVDYLSDAKDYSETNNNRKKIIELSRKAAKNEGIIGTALQAIVELASLSGWWVEEKNPELKKILKYWLENVNAIGDAEIVDTGLKEDSFVGSNGGIERLIINMLYGILIDADYVATETWENIDVPVVAAKRNLPTRFLQHDVLHLSTDEFLARMGREVIYAEIPDEIIAVVKSPSGSEQEKALLNSVPVEIQKTIKAGGDKFLLPSKLTTHLSSRNNDLTAWGTPYTTRCFPALAYKHRLRALDNSTIQGLIQRLWIVKIGSDDPASKLHIPDNKRVLLAISALKKLKTHSLMVWGGSDISTEELKSSENNVLSFKDRYDSADRDILQALGVPEILTGYSGSGNKSSDGETAFIKIEAQLERFHILISKWINKKMRQIAIQNNYKDSFPEFHFMFLGLMSKDKVKNVVLNTYEKNLLPIRRSLYLLGHDGDKVIDELIAEKEEGLREKLPINIVPYSKQPAGRPDGTGDGEGNDGRNNNTSDPDSGRQGK